MVAPAEPEPSVDPPVSAVAGQQLSLFPTEAQQFHIIQEAESAQAAPFASSIPQEVIDDFLRHGSNASKTRMRLISALAVYGDLSAAGIDLNEHYYGGYGIKVDGVKYAAWYDEAGIRISRGSSARYAPFAETVPWYDAGQRIGTLYRNGTYALNVEADEALGNERRELAQLLLYIYRDLTEEARPHYLLSLAPYDSAKGGFPEQESMLAEALSAPDKVNAIVEDLHNLQNDMARYYTETQDKYAYQRFLRFRHRGMDRLGTRLQALTFMASSDDPDNLREDTSMLPSDADPRPVAAPTEKNTSRHDTSQQPEIRPSREMTQEEIDAALQAWNGRIESKRAVVRYMEAHGRERQTAEWLKNEFKSENQDLFDRVRLENGLTLINMDASAETVLPWQKVQRRIAQLIREDRFFTEQELDNFEDVDVAAVREQLAQKPGDGESDRLAEMLRQAELASKLYEQTGQPIFAFEEGNPQPINLQEKQSLDQAQPEYVSEPVAEYPSVETGLPFDVSIQVLRTEPKPPIIIPPENFRITDDHLGEGGPKTKFRANMEAISTLKQIEAEGRNATPEEQETLSRYVGWGGLADAFDENKADWSKEYTELKETLTPEEYTAARASTLNAHYTSPTVIRAIYDALGNMGFTTGNILEPACGVGNFFGCLPQDMSSSKLYGVELDSVSGRIAKQLYPNANITVAGFETTDRRDFYDVAIGNVPFGQYQVNDRAYNKLGFSIHNYFFAKALDQVRPGGVVAFVTSRYTMDAKDSTVRRYLAQRADFLGAIRLPNNAFRANAGTDVVSDIIFLQKREKPSLDEPDWLFTSKNIPDNTPAKVGDVITFTTGYPAKEYTAEVTEVGKGYANVPYYRGKNEEREFSYISPSTVTGIERKSDLVYEINQYFLDHPEMEWCLETLRPKVPNSDGWITPLSRRRGLPWLSSSMQRSASSRAVICRWSSRTCSRTQTPSNGCLLIPWCATIPILW